MTNLPPIDMAIASPKPRFPGDDEPTRLSRIALQHLARHDGSHDYPYSWGYTLFRTVYTPGSDEDVAKAVERLAIYAKFFTQKEHARGAFDSRPNEELWSRYYCEVVQDEQALANASESEVGERFDGWIRQHRRPATSLYPEPNARFLFCLMLDEESLENILALPEDPRAPVNYGYGAPGEDAGEGWVKVISNRIRSEDEGGGGRYWLRVGITDYLWPMWFYPFDPDAMLEEMGWMDAEDGVQNLWGRPSEWFEEMMAARSG
ncbi:hypothetical protein NCS57_01482200 [Fusarium keratoplasticum]|uniref:Uncharacterized protein n=1 Tax=Fusarium keratoplasticum TaxID=1328300 RepID=A0ACC0QE55_9HYPO|nr:hypothetical protein NCS57_01482200 [Fusarium keratoplasticum]KAI8648700.1 hypothetical protein NCS57_01482200 [Fusarium keratoplasticum]